MGASAILTSGKSIVFFDTNCLLCSRFVKILLKYDRLKLYYSGFESESAKLNLPDHLRLDPQTIVFFSEEEYLTKSKAIFKILRHLRFPWTFFGVFSILPTSFNDMVYDWLARHRIAWFGRSDSCFIPTAEQKSRFFE